MRVLYLGTDIEGLGIPYQLQREGNKVLTYSPQISAGDGLLEKTDSWRSVLLDTDLVVLTPGFAPYEKVFRKFGKPYVGGSEIENILMQYKQEDFLEACSPPMCAKFGHIVYLIGAFNGRRFAKPTIQAMFHTRLMTNGLGPICGLTGVVLRTIEADLNEKLPGISKGLKKLGVRDLVTLRIDDGRITSVSSGLLPEVLYCITEGMLSELTDLLFGIAQGTLEFFDLTSDWVVGVKLTVPPYPFRRQGFAERGSLIQGISEENLKHIFPCGMQKNSLGYQTDLLSGDVLFATARGRTLREAQRRAYRTIDNIEIPFKQYRLGIGDGAKEITNVL